MNSGVDDLFVAFWYETILSCFSDEEKYLIATAAAQNESTTSDDDDDDDDDESIDNDECNRGYLNLNLITTTTDTDSSMDFSCSEITVWKQTLSSYETSLKSIDKPKLIKLDDFYRNELPLLLTQRNPNPYISKSELSKLMEWKLTRGKWRPRLLSFVSALSETEVKSASQKAFQSLPDVSKAVSELTVLKGVGPATASAVLAAYAPDVAPFMSDEAMVAVLSNSKDYTLKQYLTFTEKLQTKSKFITDNASNYKAAGDILMDIHPTIYWTPCAAHCINLMLQDIGKLKIIDDVLVKARKVVVYIYNHGRVLNMMRKLSKRELHRSCVTRFATSFYTLESMFKSRHHLQTLFVSSQWTTSAFAKTTQGKAVQLIVSRNAFWKNMQVACQALAPLVDVIRMVDREEQPCMGYIYEAMERAKLQIEKNLASEVSLSSKVIEIIDKRWTDQMEHPLHSAGYYLNPSIFYKQLRTDLHMRNVKRRLYRALEKMVPNVAESDKIRIQLEEYEVAAGDFGTPAAIRLRDNENVSPSKWWNMHGFNTPELQNFAMRVLNQTCSASPCERNWSAFDNELSTEEDSFTPSDIERALWSHAIGAKLLASPSKPSEVEEASLKKNSSKRKRKS